MQAFHCAMFTPAARSHLCRNQHQISPKHPPVRPINLCSLSRNFSFYEFDYFQYPRHARGFTDFYSPEPQLNNPFDGSILNPCMFPEFEFSPTSEYRVEMPAKKTCLSAQRLAARQRRKKISEKSGELGKLIPRGNKMNTAEMFEAAFKYVKFMQTQVAILQLMGTVKENITTCQILQMLSYQPQQRRRPYLH